jgi:hypothetical protein
MTYVLVLLYAGVVFCTHHHLLHMGCNDLVSWLGVISQLFLVHCFLCW